MPAKPKSKSQQPQERQHYDVLIIGGGINGCGVARELSGMGYSVVLAEQNDLASGTSSWSSKLVHGGLRYLEHYEFRLVRESLGERETLMNMAPHLIRPARFILPHAKGMRSKLLLRLGLIAYDWLGKFQSGPGKMSRNAMARLPGSQTVNLRRDETGAPLKASFTSGFEYSDCTVDDTRLTIGNAMAAAELGADIMPFNKAEEITKSGGVWSAKIGGKAVTARMVINAAGPWADIVLRESGKAPNARNIRLVQGSHLITKKLFNHDKPYIFQTEDGRILFAIPYKNDFTLLGTTDRDYEGDPGQVAITQEETDYILNAASLFFDRQVMRDDIVDSFSGVRPLFDDGKSAAQTVTRDYVLEMADDMWLNIFGGKLTTYRKLSRQVAVLAQDTLAQDTLAHDTLAQEDSLPPSNLTKWESTTALPGGEMGSLAFAAWQSEFIDRFSHLMDKSALIRISHAYGSRAETMLAAAKTTSDLGIDFGHGLFAIEVDYLMQNEWARTAGDVLERRSKLALLFSPSSRKKLDAYMNRILDV